MKFAILLILNFKNIDVQVNITRKLKTLNSMKAIEYISIYRP